MLTHKILYALKKERYIAFKNVRASFSSFPALELHFFNFENLPSEAVVLWRGCGCHILL